jgi:hypothetical protein
VQCNIAPLYSKHRINVLLGIFAPVVSSTSSKGGFTDPDRKIWVFFLGRWLNHAAFFLRAYDVG